MKLLLWCCIAFLHAIIVLVDGGVVIVAKGIDGVIMAADSQYSSKNNPIISIRDVNKFKLINKNVAIVNIGESRQFHELVTDLSRTASTYATDCGEDMPIEAIAHYCRSRVNTHFRHAHIALAGYCPYPSIGSKKYRIFEVLPQGTLLEQDFIAAGSGGPLATAILQYQYRKSPPDVDETDSYPSMEELVMLSRRALAVAADLDSQSGGLPKLWMLGTKRACQRLQSLSPSSISE